MLSIPRKMKLALFAVIFTVLLNAGLAAQTAQRIETLLETPALTWQDAASLVLEAAEAGIPPDSPAEAFRHASERKWLPKKTKADETARLGGIALLMMKSFDLKGGLFYRMAKSPHHAYREMVYRGMIRGNTDPDMQVSGRELLMILSRVLSLKEKESEKAAQS
jgi:hypothetical protein